MGKRILYLVRHGHAAYADTIPPDQEGYITDIGQQQCYLTAQRLAQQPIDTIYHSNVGRAIETAKILANLLPEATLYSTPLLRECVPCIPTRGWFRAISPEKLRNHQARAEQAFNEFFQPLEVKVTDQHHILVCHGNIIRYFVCRALQVAPEAWDNTTIYNCGISEVLIKDTGAIQLISHNDTGHLPYDMRTFL